jgi:hypothetical protein
MYLPRCATSAICSFSVLNTIKTTLLCQLSDLLIVTQSSAENSLISNETKMKFDGILKITFFLDVTSCGLADRYRNVG